MNTSISHITVFPKNEKRWKYYINDNFKDSIISKRNDLQHFITSICSVRISNKAIFFLDHFKAFYINIQKDEISEIKPNQEKILKKIKNRLTDKLKDPDIILKKLQSEYRKNMNNEIYSDINENFLKKILK